MFVGHHALSDVQAGEVWDILVRVCGLSEGKEVRTHFIETMTDPKAVENGHQWGFTGKAGQRATFRFPAMTVVSQSRTPSAAWITLLVLAGAELRMIVPAGRRISEGALALAVVEAADFAASTSRSRRAAPLLTLVQ